MFTVIIPTYKGYETLRSAIDSCNHELIKEIIVVDDNPEESREYPNFLLENEKVVTLYNSKNMGVTYSRNKGYFRATCDYVIFLDSDDELVIGNVASAVSLIHQHNSDLFFLNTETKGKLNSARKEVVQGDYLKLFCMANSGERLLIIKKNEHKPFVGFLRGHELCGLLLWSIKCNASLTWLPVSLRYYHQDNTTSLSTLRLSYERANLISIGHKIIAKRLAKKLKFFTSIKYLFKAIYYDYKKSSAC